jgi:hypothetical protein
MLRIPKNTIVHMAAALHVSQDNEGWSGMVQTG